MSRRLESQGSISMDDLTAEEENSMLRQLGEKMVVKLDTMKKQLMDKTASLMAEQQLRKSAEARLCNEIRKSFKLTSYNQDIALANTKLQQQLKEARTEVERLTVENTCLRSTFKVQSSEHDQRVREADIREGNLNEQVQSLQDLVEGLRDELSLRNSQTDDDSSKGGSQHDAIPEVVKQHVSDLIESTAQVFHIVATVAAHTGRQPPAAKFGISPPLAPTTPDQSDASSASSGPSHSRQASLVGSSSTSGTHEPERTCSFESNSSMQQSPLPARGLFRGSSTSSFDALSTASITSSPLVHKEDPSLDEDRTMESSTVQQLERLGLDTGPCTPNNEQADAFAVLDGRAKLELSAEGASDASTSGDVGPDEGQIADNISMKSAASNAAADGNEKAMTTVKARDTVRRSLMRSFLSRNSDG
ncbi:hypothetical protein COCOBI_07-4680 [Coccomyxa sp. Obi]|nr:hypothetical protein COCOBI_07-4680 [Coccomyxa sp. Obi]